jgi:hypothetical protein
VIAVNMNDKQLIFILYAVILGLSFFGILAVLYSMKIYGTAAGLNVRIAYIPWLSKDIFVQGTIIGSYVALGISLSGTIITKSSLKLKLINIVVFTLSLYSSIMIADRTGLIIAAFSFVITFLIQIKIGKAGSNFLFVSITAIIIIVVLFLFNSNYAGLKDSWMHSDAYNRLSTMDMANDPRFSAWSSAFAGIFVNPLGGKLTNIHLDYAHNLWLDVGWSTGIIPFILLIVFTIITIVNYVKIIKNRSVSQYLRILITTMLTGFLFTFMVEPILEGNYRLFSAFCFYSGMLSVLAKRGKTKDESVVDL